VTGRAVAVVPVAFRPYLKPALTGFLFSVAASAWCGWTAGPGLPLFFGAILLAALYVPAITLAEAEGVRWVSPLGAAIGIIATWWISLAFADVSFVELLRCAMICLVFVFALGGLSCVAARAGIAAAPAAAFVTLVGLLWLTWPVWLSHGLTQGRVNVLTAAHPLLAINGVLRHLGAWDRATIAYQRLTVLNQDIPYALPRSVLACVFIHGLIGGGCFAICRSTGRVSFGVKDSGPGESIVRTPSLPSPGVLGEGKEG
jgi:hypothetical protein